MGLLALLVDTRAQESRPQDFRAEARVVERIPPPQSRVADLDHVFARNPQALEEISQGLVSLYDDYHYSVYLVVYSGLIGSDVSSRAADFRDHWMRPHDEGLVIVFDTGSKQLSYALSRSKGKAESAHILPDYKTLQALDDVLADPKLALNEVETIHHVGLQLVAEFDKRLALQATPEPKTTRTYLAIFAIASALVMALILIAQHKARRRKTLRERVTFPEIKTPSRLGAKFGGGVIAEINYQTPDPES